MVAARQFPIEDDMEVRLSSRQAEQLKTWGRLRSPHDHGCFRKSPTVGISGTGRLFPSAGLPNYLEVVPGRALHDG